MRNSEERAFFLFLTGEALSVLGLVIAWFSLSYREEGVPLVTVLGALVSLAGTLVVLFASQACQRELRRQALRTVYGLVWAITWVGFVPVFYLAGVVVGFLASGEAVGIGMGGSPSAPGEDMLDVAAVIFWGAGATVFIGWPFALIAAR